MKIAFVDGPWPGFGHRTQRWAHKNPGGNINPPPLFQMYAASVARQKGYEIELWDAPVRQVGFEDQVRLVKDFNPHLVVVNTSTPSFDHDIKFIRLLKANLNSVIVAVGTHVTSLADDVLRENPSIDVIALREYDETIADIASNLTNLSVVDGIKYRENGQIIKTTKPRRLVDDLDTLPFPAWDKINLNDYRESMFPITKRPIATIMTGRGCKYSCSFCLYPQVVYANRLRFRSISKVIQEIQWLKKEFGVKFFYIEDDSFTASWKRVETFCKYILDEKLNITWACLSRADEVTEERLRLMKEAGCFLIKFGVETGSQEQLDHIGKKSRLDVIKHCFDLCNKVNIISHATVMLGIPGDTKESIRKTQEFIKYLAPDSVQFSICTPFPGTRFWQECVENGWLDFECWEDFDGVSGGGLSYSHLSKKEIRGAIRESYLIYHFSLAYIRKRIRRTIFGPDRTSQMLRNFWLLKRLLMVLRDKVKDRVLTKKGEKCAVDYS